MRETHTRLQPNVDIRAGDAHEVPVEDASADAIICAQVDLQNSKNNIGIPLVRRC
jgi:hypothetical protein